MVELSENSLYEAVDSALDLMDCDIGPAECHGMLCGMLCGVDQFDPSTWLGHTTGYHEQVNLSDLGAGHALIQLLDETVAGFSAEDFSLQVLLPGDDYPMAARAEALGSWCRGFLSGFGLSDPSAIEQLSEDSRGFLRDLHEIGKVDPLESEDEQDEFAFMEICEYARIGAMLLREETLPPEAGQQSRTTLH